MRQSKKRRREQLVAQQGELPSRRNRIQNNHLELDSVKPITFTQQRVFRDYEAGKSLVLHGYAGTGKTFLALYLALRSIEAGDYDKVVIVRSLVPTRDAGFLPGDIKTKAEVYEGPYASICAELYNRGDAYTILKNKGVIEFSPTSYIRGLTIDNAIIIVDEAQNLSYHELDSILTRVGNNCRVVLSGDYRQTDLLKEAEKAGFKKILDRLAKMEEISFVEFFVEDIVRSGFVKAWIKTQYKD